MLFAIPLLFTALAAPAAEPPARTLNATLARLARVAELYRDNALSFSCAEQIVYSGTESGHIRFAYLFIRDKKGRLRDFRTFKSAKRADEVDPRDYHVPRFLESAYLWAFVFRSDRQPLYHFELVRQETLDGRNAVVIEFVPRGPIRKGFNNWAGYAYIDGDSSQILEVEAYTPADWERKSHLEADLAAAPKRDPVSGRHNYDIEKFITVFGFEKNGMRFPSHVEITAKHATVVPGRVDDSLRETTLLKVTQDYSHFEFFSVRSSEQIQQFVDGTGPLPTIP